MRELFDTKEIFQQLANLDGSYGVQTLIETHDAWVHNAAVQAEITVAVRAQLAGSQRGESVMRRICGQREALEGLVVRVRMGALSAG